MDYQAALFDLDGTLLDSAFVWQEVDRQFLEKRGIPQPPDYAAAVSALGFIEASEYTIRRFHLDESPDAVMQEWRGMAHSAYAHEVRLKPGAAEYLAHLHERGLRLAVVTALERGMAEACLQNNGIYHLFEAFFHTDEMDCNKKAPRLFRQVIQAMGVQPNQCLFFDDLAPCLTAARQAGAHTIAVRDNDEDYALAKAAAHRAIISFQNASGLCDNSR